MTPASGARPTPEAESPAVRATGPSLFTERRPGAFSRLLAPRGGATIALAVYLVGALLRCWRRGRHSCCAAG